jgi:CRP-like cAMP-binding protein
MEKMAQQLMQQLVHQDLLVLKVTLALLDQLAQQVQLDQLVQPDQIREQQDQKVTPEQQEQQVLLDQREIPELLGLQVRTSVT